MPQPAQCDRVWIAMAVGNLRCLLEHKRLPRRRPLAEALYAAAARAGNPARRSPRRFRRPAAGPGRASHHLVPSRPARAASCRAKTRTAPPGSARRGRRMRRTPGRRRVAHVVLADEGGGQAEPLEIIRVQRRVDVSGRQLVERLRPCSPGIGVPAPLERTGCCHLPLLPQDPGSRVARFHGAGTSRTRSPFPD